MHKRSELLFSLFKLPIDFLAIISAYALGFIIRVKITQKPVPYPINGHLYLKVFLLIIPVWILIFAISGLYRLSSLRGRLGEVGRIFVAISGGAMFVILVDFFSKKPLFPAKAVAIYGYGISFVLVVIGRQIMRMLQRSLFRYGVGLHRVVLIGSGEIAARLAQEIQATKGYLLVGALDTAKNASKRLPGVQIFSSFEVMLKMVQRSDIDEIIQADSALEPEEVMEVVAYANNHHLIFKFVPNQFGIMATHSSIGDMAGLPVVELHHTPLGGWGRILKRGFDVTGAIVGLVIISPLFLVVGLLIKLTDPGTVFYRHRRLSRSGKKIDIYKFRTMRQKFSTGAGFSGKTDSEIFAELGRPELAAEFAKEQKLKDDPRVSPVGRVLRRTSIDELPQLINVLKGELSLVGPRPIVQDELERYGDSQALFLALKPGLTGLWQISGRNDISYDERVKLDLYYVENWSLWLDVKILLKTIVVVLKKAGAY